MKISIDQNNLLESYPYIEVGSNTINQNNSPEVFHRKLPIYSGEYKVNDKDLDLLIIASDLQGIAEEHGHYFLLGEKLPSFLKILIEIEYPNCKKIGVLLCGDLYTSLEKRGASGDVRNVWKEFNKHFEWVVGVAGNHDRFGTHTEEEQFKSIQNIHLLHKNIVELNGLKIGGISGIIGRKDKVNRVDEVTFLKNVTRLSKQNLDFLLIHETPDFPVLNQIGNNKIRACIEKSDTTRICCGHCFWENSLVEFENKSQVLNVDSKVILMRIVND
jgi:hypothetical protein